MEPPVAQELHRDLDLSSEDGENDAQLMAAIGPELEPELEREREREPEPEPEPEPEGYAPRERAMKALQKLKMSELLGQARALGVPQDVLDELLDRDGDEPAQALYSILLPQALEQAELDMETERIMAVIVADLSGEDRLQVSGSLRRIGLMFTAAAEDATGEVLAKRSAEVVAAGGVLPLLEIVQSRIHVELRRHAYLALASLAASEALQDILIKAGTVEVLVGVLRPGRYFEHQQLACSALANLVFHGNSTAERLVRDQHEHEQATSGHEEGGAQSLGTPTPEAVQRLLRAHGGNAVHWLCLLLKKGDRRSKQWSSACLCNLAQCPAAKAVLVNTDILGVVKKVLCKINAATGNFEASRTVRRIHPCCFSRDTATPVYPPS